MKPLNILYAEPTYSSLGVLCDSVPIVLRELGHKLICISTGQLPRNMDAKNDNLWRMWMEDNHFKVVWNSSSADFDLFFSRRGDTIPLQAVDEVRRRGIKTVNWEMEDPYPDVRRDVRGIISAPTYWEKTRHYNMVVGGNTLIRPWIPYAVYGENVFHEYDVEKDINVGFVGESASPLRKEWLDKFKDLGLAIASNLGWSDYNHFLARCKIVVNCHQSSTMNGRVFEAPAVESLLVTDYVPGLEKMFKVGEEVVVYKSDGIEEVKYYLEHGEERAGVARAGLERTKRDHQLKDRVEEIIRLAVETDNRVMWEKTREASSKWDGLFPAG